MSIMDEDFMKGFIRTTEDAYKMGWHERNGGNLSYRLKPEEVKKVQGFFSYDRPYAEIGTEVKNLASEYFLVTGSGKYFRNVVLAPQDNAAIIRIDKDGCKYQIVWGLEKGGRPTSELPTHLMCHGLKKEITNGEHRVILHSHTPNVIALTFVLPLDDKVFTRQLWEMATECPVIFPKGVGVVKWMVPGGKDIAVETYKLMKKYNVVIWAHHGMFCSGSSFDEVFGLMHTVEKSAEILVKVMSIGGKKQTITSQNFRDLAKAFKVKLPEEFLD